MDFLTDERAFFSAGRGHVRETMIGTLRSMWSFYPVIGPELILLFFVKRKAIRRQVRVGMLNVS